MAGYNSKFTGTEVDDGVNIATYATGTGGIDVKIEGTTGATGTSGKHMIIDGTRIKIEVVQATGTGTGLVMSQNAVTKEVAEAKNIASQAKDAADSAQSTANAAQSTATEAQGTASSASQTAKEALSTASSKQDQLTQGKNIIISGTTISTTDNVVSLPDVVASGESMAAVVGSLPEGASTAGMGLYIPDGIGDYSTGSYNIITAQYSTNQGNAIYKLPPISSTGSEREAFLVVANNLVAGTGIAISRGNFDGKITISAKGGGSTGVTSLGGEVGDISLGAGLDITGGTLFCTVAGGGSAGVSSIGGKTGAITLSTGLAMSGNQLVNKVKVYTSGNYLCIDTN